MRFWMTILLFATSLHAQSGDAFELRALGTLGGDVDTNLSCYLLGEPGEKPRVMIDGGSIVPGLIAYEERHGGLDPAASWTVKTRRVMEVLKPIEGFLLTHAHLDHLAGFIQKTTLDFLFALGGRPSLEVIALPGIITAAREHAFQAPLWVDFTSIPPKNPSLKLSPLEPYTERTVGPFEVSAIPINHPGGSAAFLVRHGDDAYLHAGDTGPTEEVWNRIRPLLDAGHLRAISLEVSWPSTQEKLAFQTGHLTPASLLLELNKLARVETGPLPAAATMTPAEADQLAAKLAPRFTGCPIFVIHIKALEYDSAVTEIERLRGTGLDLIVPVQGESYRF